MKVEYNFLTENKVWELEELLEGWETVGSKWVFNVKKKNADGFLRDLNHALSLSVTPKRKDWMEQCTLPEHNLMFCCNYAVLC